MRRRARARPAARRWRTPRPPAAARPGRRPGSRGRRRPRARRRRSSPRWARRPGRAWPWPRPRSQTAPWSEWRVPDSRMERLTWAIFEARPLANIIRSSLENSEERACQRPRSTQETGMTTFWFAPTRMVMLSTRFCLAPTSSSPSRRSTRSGRGVVEEQFRAPRRRRRPRSRGPGRPSGHREHGVVGLGLGPGEDREQRQVLEDLGRAQGERLQRRCDLRRSCRYPLPDIIEGDGHGGASATAGPVSSAPSRAPPAAAAPRARRRRTGRASSRPGSGARRGRVGRGSPLPGRRSCPCR